MPHVDLLSTITIMDEAKHLEKNHITIALVSDKLFILSIFYITEMQL